MTVLGNKEIFSKNLKYYMKLNDKSRNDICKDLGFKYTTFTDWYKGKIYPSIDKIELLANYFNIKKSDLIENKNTTDELGNPVVPIDLLGTIKAGYDWIANEEKIGTVDIPNELAKTGDFFALKVKGDSMADAILDGDIVIIKKQSFANDNNIVAAIINGDEVTLKMYRKTQNGIKLMPLNRRINPATNEPFYEDLYFTEKEIESTPVTIIGVLKRQQREW